MQVSDLYPTDDRPIQIELPNDDLQLLLFSESQRDDFIGSYGNVEVVHVAGKVYSVPAFREGRAEAIARKAFLLSQTNPHF